MNAVLVLVVLPFVLLVAVFGIVVVVALCRARPEDVPNVLQECVRVFRRFADRLPEWPPGSVTGVSDTWEREVP